MGKGFNFVREFKDKLDAIEETLDRYFPKARGYGARVIEASRYSLSAGGKRLRPILCLVSCEVVGGNWKDILLFAAGIECVHTYSLIHDDLPAMDDDDYRRGKPSCHKAFDEATAILAGDGLQALAFEFFTHPDMLKRVSKTRLLKSIYIVARAIGLEGMVGGQMVDLLMEGKPGNQRVLRWIHTHKTVKLIEASVVTGGLLGGGKVKEINALRRFGKNLGLAFQIVDDLLDVIGDEKKMGKRVGSDERKHKLTYPALIGIQKTKELAETYTKRAIDALKIFEKRAEPLKNIAEFVLTRVY